MTDALLGELRPHERAAPHEGIRIPANRLTARRRSLTAAARPEPAQWSTLVARALTRPCATHDAAAGVFCGDRADVGNWVCQPRFFGTDW